MPHGQSLEIQQSKPAKKCFRRLISLVDDFGRYNAYVALLSSGRWRTRCSSRRSHLLRANLAASRESAAALLVPVGQKNEAMGGLLLPFPRKPRDRARRPAASIVIRPRAQRDFHGRLRANVVRLAPARDCGPDDAAAGGIPRRHSAAPFAQLRDRARRAAATQHGPARATRLRRPPSNVVRLASQQHGRSRRRRRHSAARPCHIPDRPPVRAAPAVPLVFFSFSLAWRARLVGQCVGATQE